MSAGETPWFGVFTLLFQLKMVSTASLASGCELSAIHGTPKCNDETCSKPPRILHGSSFPCKVGFKTEWEAFSKRYGLDKAQHFTTTNSSNHKQFVPQTFTEIFLHPLPYETKSKFSPALNITFTVSFKNPELKAILMTFKSPTFSNKEDKRYTDNKYASEPYVYRLFDFSDYVPDTHDHSGNPILISYPCLYGLGDCDNSNKIYKVTLTSISMNIARKRLKYFTCREDSCIKSSIEYTISAFTGRFQHWNQHSGIANNMDFVRWNATIATAHLPERSIHVVVEKRSDYFINFVQLINNDNRPIETKKGKDDASYTFKEVPIGTYKVEVRYCDRSGCQNYRTLHNIIIESPTSLEKTININIITYAVLSAIGLFGLVLFIPFLLKRKNKNIKLEERNYVVISNDDRASSVLSTHLIQRTFVELKVDRERIYYKIPVQKIPNNSFIFIILPFETNNIEKSDIKKYETQLKETLNFLRRKKENLCLVYYGDKPVYMPCLNGIKKICLMKDFESLVKILTNHGGKISSSELDLTKIKSELEAVVNPEEYDLDWDCPIHGVRQRELFNQNNNCTVSHSVTEPLLKIDPHYYQFQHDNAPFMVDFNHFKEEFYIPPSPDPSPRGEHHRSLADDESLNEEIQNVNRNTFSEEWTQSTDDSLDDRLFNINFE